MDCQSQLAKIVTSTAVTAANTHDDKQLVDGDGEEGAEDEGGE